MNPSLTRKLDSHVQTQLLYLSTTTSIRSENMSIESIDCCCCCESSSSFSLPEDLLIEILLCLPLTSLLRFKSVSKSWFTLPAISLFTGQFIVQSLSVTFLSFLLLITVTLCLLAILEIKWSGITLGEWWRNEQFWLIGGTSAHPTAVLQGLLKVIAGVDISFTLTSKSATPEEGDDEFADLYVVKWSFLMVPPITIMMVNIIAIAVGTARTLYSPYPQWSKLLGGVFFSFWVLSHLYPFAKGLMGKRGKIPTIVFVWSGLLSIIISLLWVYISPPSGRVGYMKFQFP